MGCFDVTAILSWGWLKLRFIEVEVDWSWGWLKLRLIEVEVDRSWGWLKLRLIEVEVDWSWGLLKLRLIEVEVDWSWGWLKLILIEDFRGLLIKTDNFYFVRYFVFWLLYFCFSGVILSLFGPHRAFLGVGLGSENFFGLYVYTLTSFVF